MCHFVLFWMLAAMSSLATAQEQPLFNCKETPVRCEIEIGAQVLRFGMPKEQALDALSKTSYQLVEDREWSTEHKPDSRWYLSVAQGQPFAGAIRGGLKFRNGKLDGAMVLWSPESNEQSDFAASLLNLLERLSAEGSKYCKLTTEKTTHPHQEDRGATFECGLRSVSISHTRFQTTFQGQRIPDSAEIFELLGNW